MPKLNLELTTIGALDGGRAEAIINSAINRAIADLDDRGKDGKPREVTIKLVMQEDDHGKTHVHVEAGTKVPAYRVAPTHVRVQNKTGGALGLMFQADVPDNADQNSFDFDQPKE